MQDCAAQAQRQVYDGICYHGGVLKVKVGSKKWKNKKCSQVSFLVSWWLREKMKKKKKSLKDESKINEKNSHMED